MTVGTTSSESKQPDEQKQLQRGSCMNGKQLNRLLKEKKNPIAKVVPLQKGYLDNDEDFINLGIKEKNKISKPVLASKLCRKSTLFSNRNHQMYYSP